MGQPADLAIPILPSRSLKDTVEFYRRLGFEGGIHSFGDYAILKRGDIELHFFTHKEIRPSESSSMCYLRVADVESLHRDFSSARLPKKGIPRQDVLEDKPWGLREFAVVDPDGNLLRIGQVLRG
ncbi:MAG: bleomycin resistance protein [Limisphaerales bacterium]